MNRLETIREKLIQLKKSDKKLKIFGSDTHTYELPEPIKQLDIDVFESAKQISLPEEYKTYLLQIADGGAGPYYGLFSLENAFEEVLNYIDSADGDFNYDNEKVQHFINHYYACIEEGEDEDIQYLKVPENLSGILFLSEYGCGGFYVLVVKGEQAGKVWYLQEEEYLFPCFNKNKQWGFYDWFENWLDESLEELKPKSKKKKTELGTENTVINYDGHQLKEIPEKVFENAGLKKLIFSRNGLKEFPERITQFSELRNLDLSMNPFVEVSEKIGELRNLKKLNLSYNYHTELPNSFASLRKLEELLMYYNYKLEAIPEVLAQLPSLKIIHFSHCSELKKMPEIFGNLKSLESLHVNDSALESLPESFGNLHKLKYLFLGNTPLKKLPESFKNLQNLESLGIDIALLDLPDAIEKIKNLPALQNLTISALLEYPASMWELKYIKRLSISQNYDLYHKGYHTLPLPENLSLIPNLEVLDLSGNNQIKSLPENIGALSHLKVLSMGSTAVKRFPESLKELSNLELIEGSLNKNEDHLFGLLPEEKEKVINWFPNAKIRIW